MKHQSSVWTLFIPDEPSLASGITRDGATKGKKVTHHQRRRKTRRKTGADAHEDKRAEERESGVTETLDKEEETGKSR